MRGAPLLLWTFILLVGLTDFGGNGTVVAQEFQKTAVQSTSGSENCGVENLEQKEGEKGTRSSTDTPRIKTTEAIPIYDVSERCQSPDVDDVDLQILPSKAHLCPSSLRIMQSSLEAGRCSYWPEISESPKQKDNKDESRKEEDRKPQFEYKCESRRSQREAGRRGALHVQAPMGYEFPSRTSCTQRIGQELQRGWQQCNASATGNQVIDGSCWPSIGRRCDEVASASQRKAVKATLGSLPEELEQKLVACEEKLREKALTHGHLNKLGKLNKQMKSLLTKLKDMDEGWQQFAQKVAAKFDHHRKLYHTSREAIMQEYLAKSQELQAAKEEVQVASQHLFSEQPVAPVVEQADATAKLLEQAIQEDATFEDARFDEYQTQAGTIEVDEDDELMPDFGQAKPSKTAIQPFARRVQSSPTKVANLHLKAKEVEKSKSPPTTK